MFYRRTVIATFALSLLACQSDDRDGSETLTAGETGEGQPLLTCENIDQPICARFSCAEDTLAHASQIQPFWDLYCTTGACHDANSQAAGLVLAEDAYDDIVNVGSSQTVEMPLVDPGLPLNSYLFHKLSGTHDCPAVGGSLSQMPTGGNAAPFNDNQLLHIAQWICCGACREDPC